MNKDFISLFNLEEQKILDTYFNELIKNVKLSKKEQEPFINDFEKFILFFYNKKYKIEDILKKIPVSELGKIYCDNPSHWYPLDNSAKIYPLSMKASWMSIYRLSYYLDEDINEEVLQIALTYTMKRFPTFRTSIRKGFFWNYFDGIKKRFTLEEDHELPCAYINVSKLGKQPFKVVYFKNRISVEIFHALTDATGGITFLSTLVTKYLELLDNKVSYNDIFLNVTSNPSIEEARDEFLNKKVKTKGQGLIEKKAISIDGKISKIRPCQIIHFDLNREKLHGLAKKNNLTVNELIISFLFSVIMDSTSKNGNIKIQIPVNMRKFYPSKTLRNFSLYNTLSLNKTDELTLKEVFDQVRKQSKEKLNVDVINEVMYNAKKLVKSLNFLPLFIKRPIANLIYKEFGDKSSTTVLSNLGVVEIPDELKNRIVKADFVLGTTISNKVLFGLVTVNDITTLSVTKFTTNKTIEKGLYNIFKEYDLIEKIHGSEEYENRK